MSKAIILQNPVSGVYKPPMIGPSGASHYWSVNTIDGETTNVFDDILGGISMRRAANFSLYSRSPFQVHIPQGSESAKTTSQNDVVSTVVFIASIDSNKTAQITTPSMVIGGSGISKFSVAGTSTVTFDYIPQNKPTLYMVVARPNETVLFVNGNKYTAAAIPKRSSGVYGFGTNVYTSRVSEYYTMMKTWSEPLPDSDYNTIKRQASLIYGI